MPRKIRHIMSKPNIGPKNTRQSTRQTQYQPTPQQQQQQMRASQPAPTFVQVPVRTLSSYAGPSSAQMGSKTYGPVIPLASPPSRKPLGKGKATISKPVMRESAGRALMAKLAVVDLETAARMEQERRQTQMSRRQTVESPRAFSQADILQKLQVVPRKPVGSPTAFDSNAFASSSGQSRNTLAVASTSGLQLSPGVEQMKRRSLRQSELYTHPGPRTVSHSRNESEKPPHISTVMTNFSLPHTPASAPPIPVQNPRRRSRSGKTSSSRSSSADRVFTDPNRPPSIPASLLQEANWTTPPRARSPGSINSPLVPRVRPLSETYADWNDESDYADDAEFDQIDLAHSMMPMSYSVKKDIRPSRAIPKSPAPEPSPPVPPKPPVQTRQTMGIPKTPKSRAENGVFYNSPPPLPQGQFVIDLGHGAASATSRKPSTRNRETAGFPVPAVPRVSVMSRPRPVARNPNVYHSRSSSNNSQPSHHRRSQSAGSIEHLRQMLTSALQNHANGPTVPPAPRSADSLIFQTAEIWAATESPWKPVRARHPTTVLEQAMLGEESNPSQQLDQNQFQTKRHQDKQDSNNEINAEEGSNTRRQPSFASQPSLESVKRRSSTTLAVEDLYVFNMTAISPTFIPTMRTRSSSSLSSGQSASRTGSWHRRVGDSCPSFTDRKSGSATPRRIVPPRPLRLSSSLHSIIIETEPSPLESPSKSLDVLQRQLDNLDEESSSEDKEQQRMTLLQNLEDEMDIHQNHWLKMKADLDARSTAHQSLNSSVDSKSRNESPRTEVIPALPVVSETKPEETSSVTTSDSSIYELPGSEPEIYSHASPREAENQFGRKISTYCQSSNLSVTHTINHEAQPTPPDTEESDSDSGSDYDSDNSTEFIIVSGNQVRAPTITVETPGFAGRGHSLTPEESDALAAELAQSIKDAWTPEIVKTPAGASDEAVLSPGDDLPSRPLTSTYPLRPGPLRPPRRARRLTNLADIVESPQPLQNKRGTLGIFQFPSGKTSDSPSLPPEEYLIQAHGLPSARSYFDSDIDEDEGDNFGVDDSFSEDDCFDDSTIFEISNLLQSDSVPSRQSLLPPIDYDELLSEYSPELRDFDDEHQQDNLREDISSRSSGTMPKTGLWTESEPVESSSITLPQLPQGELESCMPPARRPQPRSQEDSPAKIETDSLWSPPMRVNTSEGSLWATASDSTVTSYESSPKETFVAHAILLPDSPVSLKADALVCLWTPSSLSSSAAHGILQDAKNWSRSLSTGLAATLRTKVSPRPLPSSLVRLESTSLWEPATVGASNKVSLLWALPPRLQRQQAEEEASTPTTPLWARRAAAAANIPLPASPSTTTGTHQVVVPRRLKGPEIYLPQLASSSLWSSSNQSPGKKHWVRSPMF